MSYFYDDDIDISDLKREAAAERKAKNEYCPECKCRGDHLPGCPESPEMGEEEA